MKLIPPFFPRRTHAHLQRTARLLTGVLFCFTAAACTPTQTVSVATVTLVPPTATPVSDQPVVTPTRADLFVPSDLETAIPLVAPVALVASEPLPAAFISSMTETLSDQLGVDVGVVRWVSAEAVTWRRDAQTCAVPTTGGAVEGYRVRFIVGTTVYEFQTRAVTQAILCDETVEASDAVLMAADPIAAELVGMAQQVVATRLDLSLRRVQWVSIAAYRWTDSSLGCPLPGQTYEAVEIPGYRIVVQAGDTQYLYHSDGERLYPCREDHEQLNTPEETPAAETTAEATAVS